MELIVQCYEGWEISEPTSGLEEVYQVQKTGYQREVEGDANSFVMEMAPYHYFDPKFCIVSPAA